MAIPMIATAASAVAPVMPQAVNYVKANAGKAYNAAAAYVKKASGQNIAALAQSAVNNPAASAVVVEGLVRGGVPKNVFGGAVGDSLTTGEITKLYSELMSIDRSVESHAGASTVNMPDTVLGVAYYGALRDQVTAMFPQLRGKVNDPTSIFHGKRRVELFRQFLETVNDHNEDQLEELDRVRPAMR